jgi:nitrate/nitrite transport system substrate-binding protein
VVDAAVLRAVFPVHARRRLFLKKVGAATAMAAISSVFPLAAAREAFAQGGALKPGLAAVNPPAEVVPLRHTH